MELSSSGAVLMCMGEQLTFICTTDREFIEWNVTVLHLEERSSRTRLVLTQTLVTRPLVINMMIFDITRISIIGSLSLISTLTVANVTTDVNGTEMNCTDIGNSLAETSSSVATVYVIPNGINIG